MAGKTAPPGGGRFWIALSRLSLLLIVIMMGAVGALICRNSFYALWPVDVEQRPA